MKKDCFIFSHTLDGFYARVFIYSLIKELNTMKIGYVVCECGARQATECDLNNGIKVNQ